MRKMRAKLPVLIASAGAAVVLAVLVPPACFLGNVWLHDAPAPLPAAAPGTNDASFLDATTPSEVIPVAGDPAAAEQQLSALVRRAAAEGKPIAISGAHHSMGGHALLPHAIVLDMLPFCRMSLDEPRRRLTVGTGATWSQVIPYLDQRGLAVAVMQSNSDFSVGGSISVNCHGWQNDSPPIASTVQSFRLLKPDGEIVSCSRSANAELFSLALGGYGLFGVILEVELTVVPNEFYQAETYKIKAKDYHQVYHEKTRGRDDIGLAYGRINVAPDGFLEDAIITLLKRAPGGPPVKNTLFQPQPSLLKRIVFRGSVGSDYGKNLRWRLENLMGETQGQSLSRNQIMDESATLYANRDPQGTEILHEYFVPCARLREFIAKARPVFLRHRPDLLNITVRNVETDRETVLRYAPEEVFGLVMLFHQSRALAAEEPMRDFTRELIDVALACGGRYYLPYRGHATQEQFERGYPGAREWMALKAKYDPAAVFQNGFYLTYGRPPQPR